eukprot:s5330_g4.t1
MAAVPSVNPAVWIYVLVGTENVQRHIKICPEEISCNIPLCDYEVLPPKQHDRMSRFEDKFLIMGTGMISYKYVLIAADPAARTWLFAGPASQEDVMVVKLQDKKTCPDSGRSSRSHVALCGAGEPRRRHGRQIAGQEDCDLHSFCPARVQAGVGRTNGTGYGAIYGHGRVPQAGRLALPSLRAALPEGPGGVRSDGNGSSTPWRAAC